MQCKGGDLNVKFHSTEKDYNEISITGPAKKVFEGTIEVKI
jgi:diaminopimelate epimerase